MRPRFTTVLCPFFPCHKAAQIPRAAGASRWKQAVWAFGSVAEEAPFSLKQDGHILWVGGGRICVPPIQDAAERHDSTKWPGLYRLGEKAQVNSCNLTAWLQWLGLIYLRDADKAICRSKDERSGEMRLFYE